MGIKDGPSTSRARSPSDTRLAELAAQDVRRPIEVAASWAKSISPPRNRTEHWFHSHSIPASGKT